MTHAGVNSRLLQAIGTILAALALAWGAAARAQDAMAAAEGGDEGRFEIREAELELRDGVYYLNAVAILELSGEGRAALTSGLPLDISFELEFLNRLRLWWDTEEATLRQRYQIEFHALTERYLVTNVNTGEQSMFANLDAALRYVGRIDELPVIDAALLDADRRYDVRLRVVLDAERLPGPLRLIAFWRRDWSLGSGWWTWRLDEE